MKKASVIVCAALVALLTGCGTFQEVSVHEAPGIEQAAALTSVGVARGDTLTSGVYTSGLKIGEARYWKTDEDMDYGKFGVVHLNALKEAGLEGAMFSDFVRDLWIEYLAGNRDYNFQYASLKAGAGRMSNRNAEGERSAGIGSVVPLDDVLAFRLFKNNTDAKEILAACSGKNVEAVLASNFDISSSIVEITVPNQMMDKQGDFYALFSVNIKWKMFDAATGEELFDHDGAEDNGYTMPPAAARKWIKLPVDPGDLSGMNAYIRGSEYESTVRQEIANFLEAELYKLTPHYRTYFQKVEEGVEG